MEENKKRNPRRTEKKKAKRFNLIGAVAGLFVAAVLIFGVITIAGRISHRKSPAAAPKQEQKAKKKGSSAANAEKDTKEVIDEKADNSVPMTELSVDVPAPTIREGEAMQLKISYEPEDATNPKLKWSCSEKGLVKVSEDGVLTPAKGSGKNTVTVTAKATDGSKLSAEFKLRIYPEIDPSKPLVAITFDDGPNPETTNVMLDVFEENYAKGTFFCLGSQAEKYPEVVKREYELGMEVGTHTYSHQNLVGVSDAVMEEEITKGVNAIKNATGQEVTLMRPPYGGYMSNSKVDPRIKNAAKAHGLSVINWVVDTNDWKYKNADATYDGVMVVQDGQIVLLHDIHEYNVDAVKRFVPDLIAKGYQLVTVSEMYKVRGEALDPGTVHMYTEPTTENSSETEPASTTESTGGAVSLPSADTTQ